MLHRSDDCSYRFLSHHFLSYLTLCTLVLASAASNPCHAENMQSLDNRATPTAEGTAQDKAFAAYKRGAYAEALTLLKSAQPTEATGPSSIAYWKGLCHSKLQQYEEAAAAFTQAKQLVGFKPEELDYQLGQSLYAAQKLPLAQIAFRNSVKVGYKVGPSLYYQGFIDQILEHYQDSLKYYLAILKLQSDPDNVKQAALLQIAEVKASQAEIDKEESQKEKLYQNTVIPSFQKAYEFNPRTPTAEQAKTRINEIQGRSQKTAGTMINGVPIPMKPWMFRASQDIKYDSNVIFRSDTAIIQVSNRSSTFSKTDVQGKYEFITGRTLSTILDANAYYTYYFNRTEAAVFQNDFISFTPAVRNKIEHTLFNNPATVLIDAEYNYILRDYNSINHLMYFNRYLNLVVGERLNLFGKSGGTTLLFNFKWFEHQDPSQRANDPGVTLNQNIVLGNFTSLSFNLTADWNRAVDPVWDRINYRLSTTFIWSQLPLGLDLMIDLTTVVADTVEQRSYRGYEKLLNPSISLTRRIGDFYVTFSDSYSRNYSLDERNYSYVKNIVGLSLGCRF